jgi:hypothetical protein
MNSNTNNDNLNLPLEYIMINNEIWKIDYNEGHAIEASGYKKREFLEKNIIKYSNDTIEDFLNQRKRKQRYSLSQYDEFTSYTYEIIWKNTKQYALLEKM